MIKAASACLIVAALSFGCATAKRMNRISLGMTKQQVVNVMGMPNSSMADNGIEAMIYNLSATDDDAFLGRSSEYAVVFENGVVTRYGTGAELRTEKPKRVIIESSKPVAPAVGVD